MRNIYIRRRKKDGADQDKAASGADRCGRCLLQPALDALELQIASPQESSRVKLAGRLCGRMCSREIGANSAYKDT